jgi:hypothetical protein
VKLTADDLAKVETKNIANILRKQAEGKTLTGPERKALADAVAGGDVPASAGSFVSTWDELADACNVDRRTLSNVRDRDAQLIKARKGTLARADGRHCIAAWRELLAELGVKGRGVNNPESTLLDKGNLVLRKMLVDVERAEWEFEKVKDRHLPVSDFEAALASMLTSFNAWLNAFTGRINPRLEGLDYHQRAAVLEEEIAIGRRAIARCEYLQVAAAGEFDANDVATVEVNPGDPTG